MQQVQKVQSGAKNKHVKSRSHIKKRKNRDRMYKSSFKDLDHKTVYADPLGQFTGNKGHDLREDFWEQYQPIAKEIEKLHQEKDYNLKDAVDTVAKNYDTADFNIPLYYVPEIRITNPEQTPAADLIARVSVDSDVVNTTEETEQPDVGSGLETTDDTEGSYEYSDGTYVDNQYDVVGYGLASRLEDKLVLAQDVLRATQSVAEQAHATAMRQYEERQILRGTENDSTGFEGMKDIGNNVTSLNTDLGTDTPNWREKLRSLISEAVFQGANEGRLTVFVDFDTYDDIENDLEDEVRYVNPGEELGFGFQALKFKGVQIMRTHGLIRQQDIATDGTETIMIASDMGSNYMGMLQDMTMKPLAKVAPQEQFATDAYGCFVSESPSHIQYVNATGA